MKLKLVMLVGLLTFGFAMTANAGATPDGDGDLVPDQFDNCVALANGPGQNSNQADADVDGYGTACDADYDNNLIVNAIDFGPFLTAFNAGTGDAQDHDGNGIVNALDFSGFLSGFNAGVPGPSGLACAGSIPCLP